MAKVHFNDIPEDSGNNSGGNSYQNDVGFFTLRNDNDEAIVRFMCDSVDEFDILTVHDIEVGGKYRKISCLRDPREPIENCPFCKSGARISNRFFIRLIQYVESVEPGNGARIVTPKAMIWERSTAYAKTLKSYLENYGPMSDVICKIIRHGKAGDMQTTYEIVPNLSKNVYRDDVYVKVPDIFGDFNTLGTIVMNKNFEDSSHFIMTGDFPTAPVAQNNTAPAQPVVAPQPEVTPRTYAPVQPAAAPQPAPQYAPQQPAMTTPLNGAPVSTPAAQPAPQYNSPAQPQFNTPAISQPVRQTWTPPTANTTPTGGFERPRRY